MSIQKVEVFFHRDCTVSCWHVILVFSLFICFVHYMHQGYSSGSMKDSNFRYSGWNECISAKPNFLHRGLHCEESSSAQSPLPNKVRQRYGEREFQFLNWLRQQNTIQTYLTPCHLWWSVLNKKDELLCPKLDFGDFWKGPTPNLSRDGVCFYWTREGALVQLQ